MSTPFRNCFESSLTGSHDPFWLYEPGTVIAPGLVSWACDLCSHTGPDAQGVLCLAHCSAVTALKFLRSFEEGAAHVHFASGPTDYGASLHTVPLNLHFLICKMG